MLPKPLYETSVLPWEEDLVMEPAPKGLPGISIVVPIYNAGQFLEKTLRSILCNDQDGVEIIVMDGGSTDNTAEILNYYRDYIDICVSEKDRGQSDAINKGFRQASKPILYWLNGDDLLLPNALVKARQAFRDHRNVDVIVGDAYMTELDLTPIRHFQFSEEKLEYSYLLDYASNHLVQPSVFFTRRAWDACGPVDEDLHYAMDADLFIGMAKSFPFLHLPVDIAYSVYHEDCKTRGKRAESITELALVQARHGGSEQARKTLAILVELYNNLEKTKSAVEAEARCESCDITRAKWEALEDQVRKQREQLLELDVELLNV